MRYMRHGKGLSAAAVLLAFGMLIGCGDDYATAVAPEPSEGAGTGRQPETGSLPANGPQPSATADGPVKKDQIEVASPVGNESVPADSSGTVETVQDEMSPEEARQNFNKRNYDVDDSFDAVHPTLMGLNLDTILEAVQARFGEPVDKYSLPDESSDASVFAYPGFLVGISDGRVLFVEVSSSSINPGLNGLRVGGTADDAIAAIGEPTSRTEYVLAYKSDGAVLKLDVDPKNDVIQSIKLFPE